MTPMLSTAGVHELRAVNDDTLMRLSPQTMVLAFAPFSEGNIPATQDNLNKARRHILQRRQMLPHTRIVVRWWDDDQRSQRVTSDAFKTYFPLHVPGTLMLASNEDASNKEDSTVYRRTVAWWRECVEHATAAGVTLAVGCMATANPLEEQYVELVPLLEAMRDAARKGVVHWFYSNAYWSPDDPGYREHHLERHQREVRKVCQAHKLPMPPMMLGEFGIAWDYDALAGYKRRGMTPGEFAARVCIEGNRLAVPYNVYSAGEGIHDTRWKDFDIDHTDYWNAVIQHARRVPIDANVREEERYMSEAKGTAAPPVISEPPDGFTWGLDAPKYITPVLKGANIRRAPDINAPRITGLATRTKVKLFPNSWQNPDDKETWRRIILAGGTTGYIAESAIEKIEDAPLTGPLPPLPPITPVPPVSPPPPVFPPDSDNDALRHNTLAALREMEVAGQAAARNYEEAARNLMEASKAHEEQAVAARRFREALAALWNISPTPAPVAEAQDARITQTAEPVTFF